MNDEVLYAYLDGELPEEEAVALEKVLSGDPALAARLETLGRVDAALEELPGCEAPEDLAVRVLAAARRRRRGRVLALASAVAAAAAALFLAVLSPPADSPSEELDLPEAAYVWEEDADTFGSLDLVDLQDRILEELEAT